MNNDNYKTDPLVQPVRDVDAAFQAAFTRAVRGLASQHWDKCVARTRCVWNLGAPGKHCAVGWLIPWDEQRKVRMLEQDVDAITNGVCHLYPEIDAYVRDPGFREFLDSLQRTHDSAIGEMQKDFWYLGIMYELEWPEDVPKPDNAPTQRDEHG